MDYLYGLLNLDVWGYVISALILVQVSMMAVTLYLHRDQAHRAIDLHPVLRQFFRFWIWSTSGQLTREWVAVHRKHHACCETPDDPHSPQVYGLKKVLLEGAELYQAEKRNPETLEKYGRGTPDDWVERQVYSRFTNGGLVFTVFAYLLLFGVPGIILIAVQFATMPVFAAGVINGLGHHSGYRNFECDDAATNIMPWGFFVGGEELHNNHHAFPTSAKFSVRPWEFDIGWMYIRILQAFRLVKVNRVAPRPAIADVSGDTVDIENLKAIIVNRMHVLRDYTSQVTLPTLRSEKAKAMATGSKALSRARKILVRRPALLDEKASVRLKEVLARHRELATVHQFRERLNALWVGANVSNEKLLDMLRQWCSDAENSGIKALQEFASTLRSYQLA